MKIYNKTKFVILCAACVGALFLYNSFYRISYKNFDVLEGKRSEFWKKFSLRDKEDLTFFKKIYLKRFPDILKNHSVPRIPKVLHYIWVGPREFPEKSISYVESFLKLHPDWTFKFWTDNPSRSPPHPSMQVCLISDINSPFLEKYLEKTDNYGEKSDLIRYEILYQEGGIYVDHDIECYHSFEKLVSSLDFFAGLEPPHRNSGIDTRIFPCNAVIGAKPFHPILLRSKEIVAERWDSVESCFPYTDAKSLTLKVLHRTFHSFTLAAKEVIDRNGSKDVIFPASFFYPDRITSKKSFERWKKNGLVWTSHKCDGIWKPQEKLDSPTNKIDVLKAKNKVLSKKYKQAKILLFLNFVACGFCLYFLLKDKNGKKILGI